MKSRPKPGKAPPRKKKSIIPILFLLAAVGAIALWKFPKRSNALATGGAPVPASTASTGANDDAVVGRLVAAEETYLALAPKMNALSRGLLDLQLPPANTDIFASEVSITDLGPAPELNAGEALVLKDWPVASSAIQQAQVILWRTLFENVARFEHAKVELATGTHPSGDMFTYNAGGNFEGLAQLKSGQWCSLHGKLGIDWKREKKTDGSAGPWQIVSWRTEQMRFSTSPKRLFAETLDTALRGPQNAAKLRRSLHYETTVQYYRTGMKQLPHPYFAPISVNQKEGIAIADVNGDGFDDIYISVRIGKNMLLVNQKDGTFAEQAAAYKLDLPGHTTCSLFADFDNDGDLDVMLGRSLLRTSYLENRNGVYFQHPIPKFMPMAVISMAAADYNKDGLLDVYICTYRPAAPVGASPAGGVAQGKEGDFDWPDEFFSPEIAREFRQRVAENRLRRGGTVLDQVGPPNILLINRGGGKFEPAPENSSVGIWRNSLQATWGDYDQDGDPDLFVANDWAPSNLFRNDGAAGFTDVTTDAGVTSYGFSMGASFGDYDNDGLEDVYVSNMFSDAGRRLTTKIPGLSKMFIESASGNWLYHHQRKGSFTQVSGLETPAMTVMDSGWSWGGHFVDFDNDQFLDLYVLNGYFTAPKEVASDLDLESNLWRTMLRTDENLARASFRFSPEWKRTPPPDSAGPQIDARLAGVERQGDKITVHSLQGNERNRYYANRNGHAFAEVSGLSGLDNIADSRGFAVLDYDRDGWQDVALVNANQPLFNLYHNEMAAAGMRGGMIAIKFVGGNRTAAASKEFAGRDGFGARVSVTIAGAKQIREHRCGEGWSTQNSATMIVGINGHAAADQVTVQWPSGKTTTTQTVPEGTLLIAYENPQDSPSGEGFVRAPYRAK